MKHIKIQTVVGLGKGEASDTLLGGSQFLLIVLCHVHLSFLPLRLQH